MTSILQYFLYLHILHIRTADTSLLYFLKRLHQICLFHVL